ncbi:SIR2 family NAD-dependent protein deacylase [Qipengyuania flava]|nr:SIR2 family protein [Qipengyuania flava]
MTEQIVGDLLGNFDCQPVLFVGSGLSRRYLNTPDWEGALRFALEKIGGNAPEYDYLKQKHSGDPTLIGSDIAELVFEWAWGDGKDDFPEEIFTSESKSIFLKFLLANHLAQATPGELSVDNEMHSAEFKSLQSIRPHAVITTNYDHLLELIYNGYEPIVGKQVLRYNLNAYGEVYHIHGSISAPGTMVITKDDYDRWNNESKYFASKLLTYFAEHPVIIFGYSITDKNVRTVLQDIGTIVADDSGLIENVLQVIFDEKVEAPEQTEMAIPVGEQQYRIKVLRTNSLLSVYEALTARHELKDANPALVRALAARAMKLTRSDIPKGNIEVDYKTLEGVISSEEELPKLLGITHADDVNKSHPYTLSTVGEKLGYTGWHGAHKLFNAVKEKHGVDVKTTDNRYHCAVKTGKAASSVTHKYSDEAVSLLEKVRDGNAYELQI